MRAPFGVLALQGDFAAHAAAFRASGVPRPRGAARRASSTASPAS